MPEITYTFELHESILFFFVVCLSQLKVSIPCNYES